MAHYLAYSNQIYYPQKRRKEMERIKKSNLSASNTNNNSTTKKRGNKMQQIKMSKLSASNTNNNSTTKQRGNKMKRELSPVEKNRLAYQGNFRMKLNLESKIVEQKRVVTKKEKLVSRRKNGEVFIAIKSLTPAEVAKERTVLEKLKTELAKVKDSLKYSRFNYKKANKNSARKFRNERSSLAEKNRAKIFRKSIRLANLGKENGSLEKLQNINIKLQREDYSDKMFKKDILPVLNKYNHGLPITSLSKDAITELKGIVKGLKKETE